MAEDYKGIVENLFLKRYCLKSRKENFGRNCDFSKNVVGQSSSLPDPELLFEASDSNYLSANTGGGDRFFHGESDLNGNRCGSEFDLLSAKENIWREFNNLKARLNETKNKLSDKDMEQWHDHTKGTNPAGLVVAEVKRRLKPDLCTQAWCKFYEILATFPNLVRSRGRFRTLHLCEAPGAFINALNYYSQTKKFWIQEWDWRANSLNPYYEGNPYDDMIGDDRFIFRTTKKWIFGLDDTGDLTSTQLLDCLIGNRAEYDLVTADGSVDCQEDPNEQERNVLQLHFCETVCALHTLCKGGNFVLKRFTMFEPASVALLYLICSAFEEVNLYKPATSKSGNSETYLICESYCGLPSTYLSKLRSYYGRHASEIDWGTVAASNAEIPLSFLKTAYDAQKFFIDHQLAMVNFNLTTFRSWTPDLQSQCTGARSLIVDRFLAVTDLSSIINNNGGTNFTRLANGEAEPPWMKHMPWQKRYGTYEQRNPDRAERPRYVLQNVADELEVFRDRLLIGGGGGRGVEIYTFVINGYSCPLASTEWYKDNERQPEPIYGRRLSFVATSKLCHGCLLVAYRNLLDMHENGGFGALNKDIYQLETMELCQYKKFETVGVSRSALPAAATDQGCVWIDLTSNTMSKLDWLNFLISLTSSDKPPRSVEISRSRLLILSRFSSNVLVILCTCYERVTLIARSDHDGVCTIKAENYRRLPTTYAQNFVSYLHRVKYGLTKRERNAGTNSSSELSTDLLQFLPMQYLSDPAFYKKAQRFNNTVLLKICQDMLAAVTKTKQC